MPAATPQEAAHLQHARIRNTAFFYAALLLAAGTPITAAGLLALQPALAICGAVLLVAACTLWLGHAHLGFSQSFSEQLRNGQVSETLVAWSPLAIWLMPFSRAEYILFYLAIASAFPAWQTQQTRWLFLSASLLLAALLAWAGRAKYLSPSWQRPALALTLGIASLALFWIIWWWIFVAIVLLALLKGRIRLR